MGAAQNRKLICSGRGHKFTEAHDCHEREVRDLPSKEVSDNGDHRAVPNVLPEARSEGRESVPAAEQSIFQ
jgi:hypothetical protein